MPGTETANAVVTEETINTVATEETVINPETGETAEGAVEQPVAAEGEAAAPAEVVAEAAPAPAATPRQRVNKRPYLGRIKELVQAGTYTAKAMVEKIMEEFPTATKSSVQTVVTDLKNPKYCAFKPLVVIAGEGGLLKFVEGTSEPVATDAATGENVEPPAADAAEATPAATEAPAETAAGEEVAAA